MRGPRPNNTEGSQAVHHLVKWAWNRRDVDGRTQKQLAHDAGVSVSSMRRWWKGERTPQLFELEAVINALGYKLTLEPLKEEDAD